MGDVFWNWPALAFFIVGGYGALKMAVEWGGALLRGESFIAKVIMAPLVLGVLALVLQIAWGWLPGLLARCDAWAIGDGWWWWLVWLAVWGATVVFWWALIGWCCEKCKIPGRVENALCVVFLVALVGFAVYRIVCLAGA